MAVHLPLELQVGKKLKLVILLDSAQFQICCEGTIRNRRGHRYGIEFDNLPSEDRDLILRCSGDKKH